MSRLILLALMLTGGLFSLIEPAPGQDKADPLAFWLNARRSQAAAVAELVLSPDPLTLFARRVAGKSLLVWNEPEFVPEEAPPLNPEWLADSAARDRKPMPDVRGRAPDEISRAEHSVISLYSEALANSLWTPLDAFAKSAKENRHVTFAHMYTQVDTYRGRVLHIEGRLLRLRKWDKIPKDAQEKGVKEVYEGWIALPLRGSHPVCVLFPILPEGLEPAEQVDRDVSFDGYLICLYRYRSGKGDLDTPLLIGPSVRLTSAPAEVPTVSVVSPSLLYGFAGFVALVALLVGGLSWWFRRGDRRVREHLDKLREAKALEMLEGDPEPPANGDKAV